MHAAGVSAGGIVARGRSTAAGGERRINIRPTGGFSTGKKSPIVLRIMYGNLWAYRAALFGIVLFFLPAEGWARGASERPEPDFLRVALIQFEIDEHKASRFDAFRAAVEHAVRTSVRGGSRLVVFPEYTNVFLAALPFADELRASTSFQNFVAAVADAHGHAVDAQTVLANSAPLVRAVMDTLYGGLAQRYSVHIVAGTYFHVEQDGDGEEELRNRVVVYGPDGAAMYEHDKVFLTAFEREIIGIAPGDPYQADTIEIDGAAVGITICRDTFFDVWDTIYDDADLLIDVKAEGVTIQQQPEEYFREAIPARLTGSGAHAGVTVHLVGRFLDLFWEGRSSVVTGAEPDQPIEVTPVHDRAAVVIHDVPLP